MGRFPSVVAIFLLHPLVSILAAEYTPPSLITNSPFLPPGFQPPGNSPATNEPAALENALFEFRGVYQLGGQFYYHLYNVREREGSWMTEEDASENNFRIVSFDTNENLLVLDVGGEQKSLSLIQTSNKSMPVQTAPRSRVAKAETSNAENNRRTPVRRRVIRPSVRNRSNNSAATAARRRVINRTTSNR